MTTPPESPLPLALGPRFLALVERHGSPEERRLVEASRTELLAFLAHPDTLRFTRLGSLDIGLENRLVLKINLMGFAKASPWGLINTWADAMPALRDVANTVFRHKLRCHAGIKLSPAGIEYELYPYETEDNLLARSVFSAFEPHRSGLPLAPHCFGCSSTGELSAYAETTGVDVSELEAAAGFRFPAHGLKVNALFNSRRNADGSWRTDKAGIEFTPFPSHMLNCVLGNFNLHFAYLLHRGGTRKYGVVGVHGPRQVLYTPLLPRVPPPP